MGPAESCGVSDALKGNLAWLADIDGWFCEPRTGRHSREEEMLLLFWSQFISDSFAPHNVFQSLGY